MCFSSNLDFAEHVLVEALLRRLSNRMLKVDTRHPARIPLCKLNAEPQNPGYLWHCSHDMRQIPRKLCLLMPIAMTYKAGLILRCGDHLQYLCFAELFRSRIIFPVVWGI